MFMRVKRITRLTPLFTDDTIRVNHNRRTLVRGWVLARLLPRPQWRARITLNLGRLEDGWITRSTVEARWFGSADYFALPLKASCAHTVQADRGKTCFCVLLN